MSPIHTEPLEFMSIPPAEGELWNEPAGRYFVPVVVDEAEDGFTAYVPILPGAVSEGSSGDAAIENLKEALAALIQSYQETRDPVPWQPLDPALRSGLRWIRVDVE